MRSSSSNKNLVSILSLLLVSGASYFTPPVQSFTPTHNGIEKLTAARGFMINANKYGNKAISSASSSLSMILPKRKQLSQEPTGEVGTTSTSLNAGSSIEYEIEKIIKDSKIWIIAAITITLIVNSIAIIDPGEVGILSGLGSISQIEPGIHLVNPLQKLTPFSTKTQLLNQENYVPTKEGLTVELDTSVLYRINPESVKDIYVKIGPKYENTIIVPEVSSAVRGLTSESDAKALYSGGGRTLIQSTLKEDLSERLEGRGIVIEDVLLKNLKLPEQVTASIEAKAKAEQESSRMEFVLAKERQEAERKALEAQGIADFQRIVSDGISPNLLRWKGIEATEKIAQSPNAKVVIVGSGKDGLPIILGGSEGTMK